MFTARTGLPEAIFQQYLREVVDNTNLLVIQILRCYFQGIQLEIFC